MKKMYKLIAFICLLSFTWLSHVNAQVNNLLIYSSPANTYTDVTGGFNLGTTTSDDQVIVDTTNLVGGSVFGNSTGSGLPLGFNFVIGPDTFDRVGVSINGWIRLGKSKNGVSAIKMSNSGSYEPISGAIPFSVSAEQAFTISAFGMDLVSRNNASLTYFIDSSSTVRVTTIQWKNYNKYGGFPQLTSDTLNFQIKVASDGSIALNYGRFVRIITDVNEAEVGIRDYTNYLNRSTSSNWAATTAGLANTDTCRFSATVLPVNGLSFLYSPAPPCSGVPIAGNIFTNSTGVCLNKLITIKDSGYTVGPGIGFQWYFNNSPVPGANSFIFTDTINAAGTYYCEVSCSGGAPVQTNSITITLNPFSLCYCDIDTLNGNTFGTDIGNVTVGGFTNGNATPITNNPNASNIYTNFTGLPPIPISSGISNNIQLIGITSSSFTAFTDLYANVYIDYDHDGIYNDSNELVISDTGNYVGPNSSVLGGNPLIPLSATTGITGMRFMLYETPIQNACASPQFANGETEDYLVNIQAASACSGAPVAGTAQSSDSLVCPSTIFSLSLNGAVAASGINYQWFANGVAIPGDTLPIVVSANQSANTTYTCVLTCSASSQSTTSGGVIVSMDSPLACACTPTYSFGCSGDEITGVSINGIINITPDSCGAAPFYTSYSSPVFSANPGDSTLCSFSHDVITNQYTHFVNVWIDYNDDLSYSNSERVITNLLLQDTIGTSYVKFVATSDTGMHSMRVLQYYTPSVNNPQACGTYDYGETEDYMISISDTVTTYTALSKLVYNNKQSGVKFYPNPNIGTLNFDLPINTKNASIQISDILGRTLISKSANNIKSIDLSELRNGTYTITLNLDGQLLQSKVVLNKN
jgi:GEVED domain/Secretion system C-terminal sorting domain